MTENRLMVLCTVHGASGKRGRAACGLSQLARTVFRKMRADYRETDKTLTSITAVDDADPDHGAFCAEERDEKHWREVYGELKRQVGIAKRKQQRSAKVSSHERL